MVCLANGWLLASEILGPGFGGERIRYVISYDDGLTWNRNYEYYNPGRAIGGRACPRTVQLDAETIGVAFYDIDAKQPGGPAHVLSHSAGEADAVVGALLFTRQGACARRELLRRATCSLGNAPEQAARHECERTRDHAAAETLAPAAGSLKPVVQEAGNHPPRKREFPSLAAYRHQQMASALDS